MDSRASLFLAIAVASIFTACGSAPPEESWRLVPATASPIDAIPKVNGVVLADFNGDNRLDIAAVHGDPGQLLILINMNNGEWFAPFQGEGQFVAFPNGIMPVGETASGIAVGDLDGNASHDLVISHHDTNEVTVILANGDGTFQPSRLVAVAGQIEPAPHSHNLALADLNVDGHLDIVMAQADANVITTALGDGAGGFTPRAETLPAGDHPYTVAIADFNDDGRPDVVAPNANSDDLTIGLGDGAGGFNAPGGARTTLSSHTLSLAAADMNGDGVIDLVGSSDDQQRELSLMVGDGKGAFTRIDHTFNAPARVYGHGIGDINGDGMTDVIAPCIDRSSVIVWLAENPAELRYRRVEFETPGVDSQVIAIGDIDSNGALEIVTAGWERSKIAILTPAH